MAELTIRSDYEALHGHPYGEEPAKTISAKVVTAKKKAEPEPSPAEAETKGA